MKVLGFACFAALALQGAFGLATKSRTDFIKRNEQVERALLQNIVTWDPFSLFINGERVMIMSAEFHPWRLPVPSLWLDIFQKIKAMGFNCVSFYPNWALLEGKPGSFTAEGVFDFEPFFEAASQVGLYILARPGPYINAEASFGGYPGWLQRVQGRLRTSDAAYLAATNNYVANMASIVAKAQITNGGPVILYQPENEYTIGLTIPFPDGQYMQYVEDQARNASVVVPFISNDAEPLGENAPGTGAGAVDIFGHDSYPLGFDCSNPTSWPALALVGVYHELHELQSPSTPFSLVEFQGGSYDPWGGTGFGNCAALANEEFARVFYKNNLAAGVAIQNIYMTYGGTNWGNVGYPGGYTSYDYGAAIKEDRTVAREKYSEMKLQAEFLKVSPEYLTTNPGVAGVLVYANNVLVTVTRLAGNTTAQTGSFYVVRHSDYTSTSSSNYTMSLPTLSGTVSVPTLFGALTLNGRDSKIVVTDYDVQGKKLLYSTAEVFTHLTSGDSTILVVYTGPNEMNEMAVKTSSTPSVVADDSITVSKGTNLVTLAWSTVPGRRIVTIDDLQIHILDRNTAYNYWVPELSDSATVIVNGPYLVRNASVDGTTLSIFADFNKTTTVEIIGAPASATSIVINGATVSTSTENGIITADVSYAAPSLAIPDLSGLSWSYVDSLPEIQTGYDDSTWPNADHKTTNNTHQSLSTPTSLFASDYGFNTGVLVFRGHFTAKGSEQSLAINTQGGTAYGHSVWLNGTFIGSFVGDSSTSSSSQTYNVPSLTAGASYIFTVVVDQMGFDENIVIGLDAGKAPRGILSYSLNSPLFVTTPITWKITGNLGGEDYKDQARGPLNEGGLFAERQGFHLPSPPTDQFQSGSPLTGISSPGVAFYTAPLTLSLPSDQYDIPLEFTFGNATGDTARVQLYVNGWQFGKMVGNIGPQTSFPVPEGILNYNGENWIGVMLWAPEAGGSKLSSFTLTAGNPVLTGRSPVQLVDSPAYATRAGAY